MADIKKGDLVIIVKSSPCCGARSVREGVPFSVVSVAHPGGHCSHCGSRGSFQRAEHPTGGYYEFPMLKKIDPPSEGDSLPTRADLKLEA